MIPMRKLGQLWMRRCAIELPELLDGVGLGDKLRRPSRHLFRRRTTTRRDRTCARKRSARHSGGRTDGNLDTANSERAFELLQNLVHNAARRCSSPRTIRDCRSVRFGSTK